MDIYKIYCRVFQFFLKLAASFMSWRKPKLLEGSGSIKKLPELIKDDGIDKLFIIASRTVLSTGLIDEFLDKLKNLNIDFTIFNRVIPNPTIDTIEDAVEVYKKNNCNGLLALGGGSVIDATKAVGARIARPDKSISKMKGLLRVRKKLPLLYVVPTTSGTGSEVTIASVITNEKNHEKHVIIDSVLIPHCAVLDPTLILRLPPNTTAETGMDALTHAVEAYIGKSSTNETNAFGKNAVKLIFENIYETYSNGTNIVARANMQKAAYYAGIAFTRASVGYIHAIAHSIGGLYNISHGLVNAIIMPYVLEYYGETVYKPLSQLADMINICEKTDSEAHKTEKFINSIKNLNESMGIQTKIKEINSNDIPTLIERAYHESNPMYPVPRIFTREDFFKVFRMIIE